MKLYIFIILTYTISTYTACLIASFLVPFNLEATKGQVSVKELRKLEKVSNEK